LCEYLDLLVTMGKVIVYTHVSNETYTKSWRQKFRNKAMGVRPGTPDYIIVTHKCLIFLELKRLKGGVVSAHQKEWIAALDKVSVPIRVCKGFDEAKEYIDTFI